MKLKRPMLPLKKFADGRRKKKPITPEKLAKMAANEKRRLEKLARHTPKLTNPEHRGLVMASLLVGADPELVGLVAGLSIDIKDPAEYESNETPKEI